VLARTGNRINLNKGRLYKCLMILASEIESIPCSDSFPTSQAPLAMMVIQAPACAQKSTVLGAR